MEKTHKPSRHLTLALPYFLLRFLYYAFREGSWRFLRCYPGYHGSTIPSGNEIKRRSGPPAADPAWTDGVDLNTGAQIRLARTLSPYFAQFDFPARPGPKTRYYYENPMFGYNDGLVLYSLLRHLRPRRVVEVGSGYSSALMLDVQEGLPEMELTFIEPYPTRLNRLLRQADRARCRIVTDRVQRVAGSIFEGLGENDILFIDTSHVVKVGSDLSTIFFSLLPALKKGTVVHIHDVWWPFEYPEQVLQEGYAWNECYFVRSFLQFNGAFEILYFSSYLEQTQGELLESLMPGYTRGGGQSLWLRKTR